MRVFLLFLIAAPLAGCLEKLSAPDCTPGSFSEASLSGDTITTTTGLRYIEGTPGSGNEVDWCRNVAIHYNASLLDGTEFDTSEEGSPLFFAPGVGSLIDGIEQGVIGMRVGGTRRLIIPPALGFGAEPRRDTNGDVVVPGNSTIVFDVSVVQAGP